MLLNYEQNPGFVHSMPQFLIIFPFLCPVMDCSLAVDECLDFSHRQRKRWHWEWMVGPGRQQSGAPVPFGPVWLSAAVGIA